MCPLFLILPGVGFDENKVSMLLHILVLVSILTGIISTIIIIGEIWAHPQKMRIMYGWMGISVYLIFHKNLPANTLIFWFMMQIAIMLGFFTAWPVNAWLLKEGIKEPM